MGSVDLPRWGPADGLHSPGRAVHCLDRGVVDESLGREPPCRRTPGSPYAHVHREAIGVASVRKCAPNFPGRIAEMTAPDRAAPLVARRRAGRTAGTSRSCRCPRSCDRPWHGRVNGRAPRSSEPCQSRPSRVSGQGPVPGPAASRGLVSASTRQARSGRAVGHLRRQTLKPGQASRGLPGRSRSLSYRRGRRAEGVRAPRFGSSSVPSTPCIRWCW